MESADSVYTIFKKSCKALLNLCSSNNRCVNYSFMKVKMMIHNSVKSHFTAESVNHGGNKEKI